MRTRSSEVPRRGLTAIRTFGRLAGQPADAVDVDVNDIADG